MPELPDILVYVDALRARVVGHRLTQIRVPSPFLLRTYAPPLAAAIGRHVADVSHLGKRIVLALGPATAVTPDRTASAGAGDEALYLVVHLMIAGRLRWLRAGARPPGRITLALFEFESGTLALTEASPRKRAALHVISDRAGLAALDAGGIDMRTATLSEFRAALQRENHTLKRVLTDPHVCLGIGNAYSDEILHAARLSPLALSARLSAGEIERLYAAARGTLAGWTDRLKRQFGTRFPGPGEVTAYRPDFAVHGKYGHACPVCGAPVQRIRYAENETNYCPGCQTGGRILADRSLSRLLKADWPRTLEELEEGRWGPRK